MDLRVEKTLKANIQKNLPKSQKFERKMSVVEFLYSQPHFFAACSNFHCNEQKVTSNEQKIASNKQKSKERRPKSNKLRAKNNEQRAASKKFSFHWIYTFFFYKMIYTMNENLK